MLRRNLIFIIVLFLSLFLGFARGQDNVKKDLKVHRPSISVYVQPLNIVAHFSRFQLGVDYRTKGGVVFGLVGAFHMHSIATWESREYKIFDLRPQVRYYLFDSSVPVNIGIGIDMFFTSINLKKYNSHYFPENRVKIMYSKASYIEKRIGMNILGSLLLFNKRHFVLETFLGFGWQSRDIYYEDVIVTARTVGYFFNYYGSDNTNVGYSTLVSATFGFKIGYRFYLDKKKALYQK